MSVSFAYPRTIHFPDTDAAGVVFFARYLFICHEAYEEALAAAGVNLATFFGDNGLIIPIAKSEASYLRPLVCGDRVSVELSPSRISENSFAIDYVLWKLPRGGSAVSAPKRAAVARTEHVCIDSRTRERRALPAVLANWLDTVGGQPPTGSA